MNNKLTISETQQIQPWVKHFLIHVVKRCCLIIVAWIDEMKESGRVVEAGEPVSYNGRKQYP